MTEIELTEVQQTQNERTKSIFLKEARQRATDILDIPDDAEVELDYYGAWVNARIFIDLEDVAHEL